MGVLVFPRSAILWTRTSRRMRAAYTDERGRFRISGLPPGEYMAVAARSVGESDLGRRSRLLELQEAPCRSVSTKMTPRPASRCRCFKARARADVVADDCRRGLPRLARAGLPVHAGHQLPPVATHLGPRQGFPLHHPVHLPGGPSPRQPGHGFHRRAGVLSGDDRGDQGRQAIDHHGVLHLREREVGHAFIDALSERARNGINVTIVVDAIGSLSLWGRPVSRLRAAGAASSPTRRCVGIRFTGSTTAPTVSC